MTLAVTKQGVLSPSIYDYPFHLIILKNIEDESDVSTYKLNLQKRADSNGEFLRYSNWLEAAKPGAALEVQMQERKGNEKFVDQFKPFVLKKKADESPARAIVRAKNEAYTDVVKAPKLIVALQLEKINDAVRIIQQTLDI